MFGYMSKILRVDLTDRKVTKETLDENILRKFIGGRCLGAKILFDELKPGIDPLGPENRLIIWSSVFAGIPISGGSAGVVMAKSPLTGIWGEAHFHGEFPQELKFAGYDGIVVEGKADSPIYLWIKDGHAEIRDAGHLWGKFTRDVQRAIRAEVGDDRTVVGSIGMAGENLVKYANVMFGYNHTAGRCGLGAVMGSKKLKAVAVRGTGRVKCADEGKVADLALKELVSKEPLRGPYWPNQLGMYGSNVDFEYWQNTGRLPTMNFKRCTFPGYKNAISQTMNEQALIRVHACPYCVVPCNRVVESHYPYEVDPDWGGPEYETVASLGSYCMNDNLNSILKMNELCNKYGMDTISTGVTLAFTMECYEKGLLTKEDVDGLEVTWGNYEVMIQLIEKIAKRQGVGDLLAEGVKRMAEKIGKGSERFAIHCKGQEWPMHEPRAKKGHGLSMAISNRGACHLQHESDDIHEEEIYPEIGYDESISRQGRDRLATGPEKARQVKIIGDLYALYDALPICKWTVYACGGKRVGTFAEIINAATGWNVTIRELMLVGERAFNLCRAFNIREGITRKDDMLPRRFMEEPLPDGPYKGEAFPQPIYERLLDQYYEFRGWTNNGIPTRKKLDELGLDYATKELESLGILT